MIHTLRIQNTGPAPSLPEIEFGERLNLITGDNGLGKSFLLDIVWWALTRKWPGEAFSRGMRQRVALERALIHGPRLVLLDEPFTGLDDASASALLRRLHALRAAGTMVVVATHDLDLADGLLDHALFLRDGRPAASMVRPERLRSAYQDVMARASSGAGA